MKIPNPWEAAAAAVRVVKQAAKHEPLSVSEATMNARLKACHGCAEYLKDSGQCNVCTCFVFLKAQLTTESCPRGKWPVCS